MMGADPSIAPNRAEGVIEETLPALSFRVKLADERIVLAHLAGKLRLHRIRVVAGDRVVVELSPDGRRGRIVRRL
jgi:translation initiation factor IF-1